MRILSEQEIKELADFVLQFFNCNRGYEIIISEGNSEDFKNWSQKKYPDMKAEDLIDLEHGRTPRRFSMKNVPCQFLVFEGKSKTKFVIAIWKKFFSKYPHLLQMSFIIHEARHIAEYPHIFTEEESGQIDKMLLKEFQQVRAKSLGGHHVRPEPFRTF